MAETTTTLMDIACVLRRPEAVDLVLVQEEGLLMSLVDKVAHLQKEQTTELKLQVCITFICY